MPLPASQDPVPDLVDSHVHLDALAFSQDRASVLKLAHQAGVRRMVIPGVNRQSWQDIRTLCHSDISLFPAYGLHPMYLSEHALDDVQALSAWLDQTPAVAIGEIGLDFHRDDTDVALQRRCFTLQLALASERRLPVIVHARAALEEVTLTLRRVGGLSGVVHSFSGSEQQAQALWKLGFHIGIGGPVTYQRAQRLRRIVAAMPIEFLLLESDAPDQPDAQHRGQRNEPARMVEVLRCIAALRSESEASVAAATTDNAHRLFGLVKPKPDSTPAT